MGIFWMLLDGLVTVVLSALSGMGVGGGSLLLMYLTEMRGMEHAAARGVNLLCFLISGMAALPIYFRSGLVKDKKRLLLLLIPGAIAVVLGSGIAAVLPSTLTRKLFGGFLVIGALISLFKKRKKTEE